MVIEFKINDSKSLLLYKMYMRGLISYKWLVNYIYNETLDNTLKINRGEML